LLEIRDDKEARNVVLEPRTRTIQSASFRAQLTCGIGHCPPEASERSIDVRDEGK